MAQSHTHTCVALLEVCPAAALDEQGVSGEHHASSTGLCWWEVEGHAAVGVAWGGDTPGAMDDRR